MFEEKKFELIGIESFRKEGFQEQTEREDQKKIAVIVASGRKYGYLALNAAFSVFAQLPNAEIHVLAHDLSQLDRLLIASVPNTSIFEVADYEKKDSRSAIAYSQILKFEHTLGLSPTGQTIIFLDADAMLLSNPLELLPKNFELALTFKAGRIPLNAGVMYLRNTPEVRRYINSCLATFESFSNMDIAMRSKLIEDYGGLAQGVIMTHLKQNYVIGESDVSAVIGERVVSETPGFPPLDIVDASFFNDTTLISPDLQQPAVLHFKSMTRVFIEDYGTANFAVFGPRAKATRQIFEDSLSKARAMTLGEVLTDYLPHEESTSGRKIQAAHLRESLRLRVDLTGSSGKLKHDGLFVVHHRARGLPADYKFLNWTPTRWARISKVISAVLIDGQISMGLVFFPKWNPKSARLASRLSRLAPNTELVYIVGNPAQAIQNTIELFPFKRGGRREVVSQNFVLLTSERDRMRMNKLKWRSKRIKVGRLVYFLHKTLQDLRVLRRS